MKRFRFLTVWLIVLIFIFSFGACTITSTNSSLGTTSEQSYSSNQESNSSNQETSSSSEETSSSSEVSSNSSEETSSSSEESSSSSEESSSSSKETSSSSEETSSSSEETSSSSEVSSNSSEVSSNSSSVSSDSSSGDSTSEIVAYNINIVASANGSVVADRETAPYGENITLTITADTHYEIDWVKVNGDIVDVENGKAIFVMPSENVEITYAFKATQYAISVLSSPNGSVVADRETAPYGENITLTITADTHYEIDWVKVNGEVVDVENGKAIFVMPSENVEITYAFKATQYSISVVSSPNGSITVSTEVSAWGERINVKVVPNSGYALASLQVRFNGETLPLAWDTNNEASFTMPQGNISIEATFNLTDTRELIDYLILGDSYTDGGWWPEFPTDMEHLPGTKLSVGIGGTHVPQWGKNGTVYSNNSNKGAPIPERLLDGDVIWEGTGNDIERNIIRDYNVNNFVFHIGVNDIDHGATAETVISDLKLLFSEYHTAYPNANIYWISLSLNSRYNTKSVEYTQKYKAVNAAIKEYADITDYLTYINTVDTMFPNGEPDPDWFVDGLHFNPDGYATWSALIAEQLGYPRADLGMFGSTYVSSNTGKDMIYSSATWNYDQTNNTLSNSTGNRGEQSLWFKEVSVDAYAELKITVNSVANSDKLPKFGMAVKSKSNHVFFFIDSACQTDGVFDMSKLGTGKAVGFTERKPVINENQDEVHFESRDYNWAISKAGIPVVNEYVNGNYITLGLLRAGSEVYFFVDGVLVSHKGGFTGLDEGAVMGLTLFNLNVTIKDFSITTDVSNKYKELGITSGASAYFEGYKDSLDITTRGNAFYAIQDVNKSAFYYETSIKVNSVLDDEYPKYGITLEAENGDQLFFYIDAVNTSAFGSNKWVAIATKPSGGGYEWAKNSTLVSSLNYGFGETVKFAVYKNGSRIIGFINDIPVLETYLDAYAGNVKVGYIGFNLDVDVSDSKIATSNSLITYILNEKLAVNDLKIDADLSDWTQQQKSSPYGAEATDGSGKKFTVYAFMGTNGIYVGYEIVHGKYDNTTEKWWEATNVEMRLGNANEQVYVSANGQSRLVSSYAMKTVKEGDLYKTIVELVIRYDSCEYSGIEDSVKMGFACKTAGDIGAGMTEGNNGDWWCGPKHCEINKSTVAKSGGIS